MSADVFSKAQDAPQFCHFHELGIIEKRADTQTECSVLDKFQSTKTRCIMPGELLLFTFGPIPSNSLVADVLLYPISLKPSFDMSHTRLVSARLVCLLRVEQSTLTKPRHSSIFHLRRMRDNTLHYNVVVT